MKRFLKCMMAVLLMFGLTACTAKDETASGNGDGQNPIMNYVGVYGHDRASILVEAMDQDQAKFTVTWASSAAENSEWIMSGTYDEETRSVSYTDGTRTNYVYKSDGSVESEEQVYFNGKGTIFFHDDNTLTWEDQSEHIADDTVFVYAS